MLRTYASAEITRSLKYSITAFELQSFTVYTEASCECVTPGNQPDFTTRTAVTLFEPDTQSFLNVPTLDNALESSDKIAADNNHCRYIDGQQLKKWPICPSFVGLETRVSKVDQV